MKELSFLKIEGSGNDFILFDNREDILKITPAWIQKICARRTGIGADGIIVIENSKKADFKMRIINSDGSEAEMCGNGARCAAKFATLLSIAKHKMIFETIAGLINAEVFNQEVKVNLPDPINLELSKTIVLDRKPKTVHHINTGVPHTVLICEDIVSIDVETLGRKIRYHQDFAPQGTNVNFVKITDKESISIRTYERGVESETLSCGTGSVASACICYLLKKVYPPVKVKTAGGEYLVVNFEEQNSQIINLSMKGPVSVIYEGKIINNFIGGKNVYRLYGSLSDSF
ncbi:MAG: diaminopimelate epimerase [bacterium]|nr:diaminopimelate epimerase [bacterium]